MSKSKKVLEALRENIESDWGNGWGCVYLDNAKADSGLSDLEFRSCLSVLSQRGLYKVVDGLAFGEVKIA